MCILMSIGQVFILVSIYTYGHMTPAQRDRMEMGEQDDESRQDSWELMDR